MRSGLRVSILYNNIETRKSFREKGERIKRLELARNLKKVKPVLSNSYFVSKPYIIGDYQ